MNAKTLLVSSLDFGTRLVDVHGAVCPTDFVDRVKIAFQLLGDVSLHVYRRPVAYPVLDKDSLPAETPVHRALMMPAYK